MAIVKWDPLAFRPWFRWPHWMEEWEGPEWSETSRGLRLQETDKNIIAEAVVAGVPAENIEVTVENGVLTIKAEAEEKEEKKKAKRFAAYQYYYTAALSGGDWPKTKAEIEDGVLMVTIPKAAAAKPKKVRVTAKKKK